LIPLFLFLAHRRRISWLVLLAVLFLAFVGTGHYYVSFIIGVMVAQYGHHLVARLRSAGSLAKVVVFMTGLLLYQGYGLTISWLPETPTTRKWGWVITSLGCAVILLSTFSSSRLQGWLNHKAPAFLGRISYSVYLLQFIIILCLLPPLVRWVNGLGMVQPLPLFGLTILVSVVATLGCATITYRFIEVPAINLGHRLTKEIQRRFQN
jgi:peptidoglycan/LPS O-acetylase OafA/YrhL